MRKFIMVGLAALAALVLAACDETYEPVQGTDQVLVRDEGDKIDGENLRLACQQQGRKTVDVRWVGNGKTDAIVTCK